MKYLEPMYLDKFIGRCSNYWIYDKSAKLVKLGPNYVQKYVLAHAAKQVEEGQFTRLLVIKARQPGVSTIIQALAFDSCLNIPGFSSFTLSHQADSTRAVHDKSLTFLSNLPGNKAKSHGINSILFKNGSKMRCATSSGHEVGSGHTFQFFHWSEVAKSERVSGKARNTYISAMQAVPRSERSCVVLESTAQGRGGLFYELCESARKKENEYSCVFVPWFIHSEYQTDPKEDFEITTEEKELQAEYKLTIPQLCWRRNKISTDCLGNLDYFRQEYPSNYEEAWLAEGRYWFNRTPLLKQLKRIKDSKIVPKFVGEFDLPTSPMTIPAFRLCDNSKGRLKIWEFADPKETYVIGVDGSQGLLHGDNSVIEVFKCSDLTQVAEFAGQERGDTLAQYAYLLGKHYNMAMIAVEVNQDMTTAVALQNFKYYNLHHRNILDTPSLTPEGRPIRKLGWWSDRRSKRLALDVLHTHFRAGEITINCPETIDECLNYLMDDQGRGYAPEGRFDDRVMATAIAVEMRRQHYRPAFEKPRDLTESEKAEELHKKEIERYKRTQRIQKHRNRLARR